MFTRPSSEDSDPRAEAVERVTALDRLDELFEESHERPVWLFKHSLTCPISSAAWREFRDFVDEQADDGDARFTVIEVQRARPVSNAVAERTGIRHESPQAILLAGGRPVWNASHWKISAATLAGAAAGPEEAE